MTFLDSGDIDEHLEGWLCQQPTISKVKADLRSRSGLSTPSIYRNSQNGDLFPLLNKLTPAPRMYIMRWNRYQKKILKAFEKMYPGVFMVETAFDHKAAYPLVRPLKIGIYRDILHSPDAMASIASILEGDPHLCVMLPAHKALKHFLVRYTTSQVYKDAGRGRRRIDLSGNDAEGLGGMSTRAFNTMSAPCHTAGTPFGKTTQHPNCIVRSA